MAALDLSAAFDTVDHSILLNRLGSRVGISGVALQWVKSYLSGRIHSVKVGMELSEPVHMDVGVPQGSVLGPLFFLVYVLPIGDIMKRHGISYHVYADEIQLYLHFDPESPAGLFSAIVKLENCLAELCEWMLRNMLRINPDKTDFIFFARSHIKLLIEQL